MSTTLTARPTSFLAKVLGADAILCVAAAAVTLFIGVPMQGQLGLPATLLVPASFSLFAYAGFAAWLARRGGEPRAAAWAAVGINLAWGLDCLLVAFGPWFSPTAFGQAFLLAQVLTVVVFAELQVIGLRRARG
jgi:hypothetical protein